MKVATWNVNSLRVRLDHVLTWLDENEPDVLCLQETKVTDGEFPVGIFEELGYEVHHYGQKSYNGVAIACLEEARDVVTGFSDGEEEDPSRRLIAATIGGIRIISAYFPNGFQVGSDKYQYKLKWMQRLEGYLKPLMDEPVLLCGDFNVAPLDIDVWDPSRFKDDVLTSNAVRESLESIRKLGFIDAFREVNQESGIFSWWDYRTLGLSKGQGVRIDHHYLSASLKDSITNCFVDIEERKKKKPSDHAPVVIEFDA